MVALWCSQRHPDLIVIEAIAHFEHNVSIRYGDEFDGDTKRMDMLTVEKMTTREPGSRYRYYRLSFFL
jgi:hypothetical protein